MKRPFITAGLTAFVLMLPLALTSTKGWIRRLGRRWQLLHRLVYVSAIAACLHFLWKVKVVIGEPVYYAAILAVLLGFRLLWRQRPASGSGRPRRPEFAVLGAFQPLLLPVDPLLEPLDLKMAGGPRQNR